MSGKIIIKINKEQTLIVINQNILIGIILSEKTTKGKIVESEGLYALKTECERLISIKLPALGV